MTQEPMEAMPGPPEGEIELAHVERELAALWAAAAPEHPEEEPAVLRACSLNLLVLGSSPADLDRARPIAAGTTLRHPSRILLLAPEARGQGSGVRGQMTRSPDPSPLTPDPSSGVGARISTFCHRLGGGGRHVCCEEITLLARGAAAQRLREAALPLLVPDLPVHLWVPDGAPQAGGDRHGGQVVTENSSVSDVAELADEVIWSARGPDDRLGTAPHRSRPPGVVDLDWMRILPWRELTAQLFDAPGRRALLERLDEVEVVVAQPPHGRPGAGWLWIGWLASRLGWNAAAVRKVPPGHGGRELQLHGAEGTVMVRIVPVEAAGVAAGELLSIRLRTRDTGEALSLERRSAPERADLWISAGAARCVHFGGRDEAVLLGEALDGAARDPIYEAAWEMAVQLWRDRRPDDLTGLVSND